VNDAISGDGSRCSSIEGLVVEEVDPFCFFLPRPLVRSRSVLVKVSAA